MNKTAVEQYRAVGLHTGVADADPHRLIGMLLEGALERIAMARGAIERGETSRKGELISRVIAIVDSLRASVDVTRGGDIAANLIALYDYIEQLLVQANLASDRARLDEAVALMSEIKRGWEGIAASAGGAR